MDQRLSSRLCGNKENGVGLIVAVVLLTIVAFGFALIAPAVFQITAADNSSKTAQNLESLKIALTGNPAVANGGGRADFGFIGTMGSVPTQLSMLWQKGSQPAYSFDTLRKAGAGWIGPYVPSAFVNELLALDKDRYGNDLVYASIPFTRPSDGQLVAARIASAGADATPNTSDDQEVDILKAELFSTVTGTLTMGGNPVQAASVALNAPINGALTQTFDTTDSNGVFQFNDVLLRLSEHQHQPKAHIRGWTRR